MFKQSSLYRKIRGLDERDKLSKDITNLETELKLKDFQITHLKKDLEKLKAGLLPNLDFNEGDRAPVDSKKRKEYVINIRIAFEDWLKFKLRQMIVSSQKLLSDSDNDRKTDMSLKGTIYALNELLEWGERMSAEAMSYDLNQSSTEQEINRK